MSNPRLIAIYDQHKADFNQHIDEMVATYRESRDAGLSHFEIFGRQIAAMDAAKPSVGRLCVLVALLIERLAKTEAPRS